ncbi:hypothetical protein Sjap_002772 [Stephania japonica]|uniref:Uncharacterized protein n=1 Tax=Stephania japonica TaxID=461633 RepID=A0AAP0KMG7_9MAGN
MVACVALISHNLFVELSSGLLRCGKSCRLRWINYLKPDIKRGNFSRDEEETIIRLHESLGNKWSLIASHLPGRTDNEIKNVWNTHLKKKLKSNGYVNPCNEDINNPSESSSSSSSSTSHWKRLYLDTGLGIEEEEEEEVLFINDKPINDPLEEAYMVLSDTQKESVENLFSDNDWIQPIKCNPCSLEDARDVSSPSYSTCSSYVSHPNQLVPQGAKQEEQTTQQLLDPLEELLEIPLDETDMLDILDGKSSFLLSNEEPALAETASRQETISGSIKEVSRKEVDNGNWLEYLEYELGVLEENSLTENAFETQRTSSPSIDEILIVETEIDPVAMYFQTWSSSSSSPPDSSLSNQKQ